jgi:hypothetical protein
MVAPRLRPPKPAERRVRHSGPPGPKSHRGSLRLNFGEAGAAAFKGGRPRLRASSRQAPAPPPPLPRGVSAGPQAAPTRGPEDAKAPFQPPWPPKGRPFPEPASEGRASPRPPAASSGKGPPGPGSLEGFLEGAGRRRACRDPLGGVQWRPGETNRQDLFCGPASPAAPPSGGPARPEPRRPGRAGRPNPLRGAPWRGADSRQWRQKPLLGLWRSSAFRAAPYAASRGAGILGGLGAAKTGFAPPGRRRAFRGRRPPLPEIFPAGLFGRPRAPAGPRPAGLTEEGHGFFPSGRPCHSPSLLGSIVPPARPFGLPPLAPFPRPPWAAREVMAFAGRLPAIAGAKPFGSARRRRAQTERRLRPRALIWAAASGRASAAPSRAPGGERPFLAPYPTRLAGGAKKRGGLKRGASGAVVRPAAALLTGAAGRPPP